jgi:predicted kinase
VLRSDEIRKRLCGGSLLERLGSAGYSPEISARVYATLAERAALVLRNGHSAIIDAVCARRADRDTIEAVAQSASVPFVGLWLEAPEPVLIARAQQRRNDPSDANADVIHRQRERDNGIVRWSRIDASRSAASVLSCATERVRAQLRGLPCM